MSKRCSSICSCESQEIHDDQQDKEMKEFKAEYDQRKKSGVLISRDQLKDIVDIELDGIDTSDYPDSTIEGAFITNGVLNNKELTDEELDYINDNYSDFVYECVINQLY